MQKLTYPVKSTSDGLSFEFSSVGTKGTITKRVVFQLTDNPEIYNFAFGDVNESGGIDDTIESNNGDIAKVMATVANTLFSFFDRYPEHLVYIEGSSEQRNILYQRIIQRYGMRNAG